MTGPVTVPRRGFLKKGILGGALLMIGGAGGIALRSTRPGKPPKRPLQLLSSDQYAVLAAIAARVVPGDSAPPAWPSAEAVDCAGKIDSLLATAHPEVGKEFKQLLGLFENGLSGLILSGRPTPFTRLAPAEQDARLEAWRRSSLALIQSGYQALVRLVHATYYASPEVYPLVGYPGPPVVPT
jgi:hypothetical protein